MAGPFSNRLGRRLPTAVAVALWAAAALAGAAAPTAAPAAAQPLAPGTYTLVDTWQDVGRPLVAGAYQSVADVASAPDGRRWLLDRRGDLHGTVVHAFDADGSAVSVFSVEGSPRRIAANPAGRLVLLETRHEAGSRRACLLRTYDARGTRLASWEYRIDRNAECQDVGLAPDGAVYVSVSPPFGVTGDVVSGRVVAFTEVGRLGVVLNGAQLWADDGRAVLAFAALDVAPDGRLFAGVHWVRCQSPPPQPPQPTEPRSLAAPAVRTAVPPRPAGAQQAEPRNIDPRTQIVVLTPELELAETLVAAPGQSVGMLHDLVVLPDQVFVSQWVGQDRSYLRRCGDGACGERWPVAGRGLDYYELVRGLAGALGHGLTVAFSDCTVHGVVSIADARDPAGAATFLGRSDSPPLGGPVQPLRVAAADDVFLMEGAYRGEKRVVNWGEPLGVQTWSEEGLPLALRTHCHQEEADLAAARQALYTVFGKTPHVGHVRRYDGAPADTWSTEVAGPGPWRLGAGADTVAVLALGARRMDILAADTGRRLDVTHLPNLPEDILPVDVAVGDEGVFLLDAYRERVLTLPHDASPARWFPIHDAPRAMARGEDGRLFVLGANGWVLRYAPLGTLEARWRLPREWSDERLEAADIAVAASGRVYVPFTRVVPSADGVTAVAERGGVWVFVETDTPYVEPPPEPAEACLVGGDKVASPSRLTLGSATTVDLTLGGTCPGVPEPHQVMLVMDTSGSVCSHGVLHRARVALFAVSELIRPEQGELGLVRFDADGTMVVPLSADVGAVVGQVARLLCRGGTSLAPGLAAAHAELTGVRGRDGARKAIVIASDGALDDNPAAALEAARAEGILLRALLLPGDVPLPELEQRAGALFTPDEVFYNPTRADIRQAIDPLRGWTLPAWLFEWVEIDDELPPNLTLVPGSARPAAIVDGSTLRWRLPPVRAGGVVSVTYQVVPRVTGHLPVNVEAAARYRDGTGRRGSFMFPVPWLEVLEPPPPPPLYLPRVERNVKHRHMDTALAETIWRAIEAYVSTRPPDAVFPAWQDAPSETAARANAAAACYDVPRPDPPFDLSSQQAACRQAVSGHLALYFAARAARTGAAVDRAWARAYYQASLDSLAGLVFGPEDRPQDGYRDSVTALWQNPLRAATTAVVADLLRKQDALDAELTHRSQDVLSGVARAWLAAVWSAGVQPGAGRPLTTRSAPSATARALDGGQVVPWTEWTFRWDADQGASPADEAAWMGAGVMLASRILAPRLDPAETAELYAAGRHFVDFAVAFDRPDPLRGGNVRTLNRASDGGPYGKRPYWIEDLEPHVPSPAHMAATWRSIGAALLASDRGPQEPWPSLVPDDQQWSVMLKSAGETLRAPDGTFLLDTAPGRGMGYNVGAFPEWVTECGQYRPGRNFVRVEMGGGQPPRYLSTMGYPAGLEVLATGWPLLRIALERQDAQAREMWRARLLTVLHAFIAEPPDPRLSRCKVAPYVSSNPAYHWARMLDAYLFAYLGAKGHAVEPWAP